MQLIKNYVDIFEKRMPFNNLPKCDPGLTKTRPVFTLQESRVMLSRFGWIGQGSQYPDFSGTSPWPPRIYSILGFCKIQVKVLLSFQGPLMDHRTRRKNQRILGRRTRFGRKSHIRSEGSPGPGRGHQPVMVLSSNRQS